MLQELLTQVFVALLLVRHKEIIQAQVQTLHKTGIAQQVVIEKLLSAFRKLHIQHFGFHAYIPEPAGCSLCACKKRVHVVRSLKPEAPPRNSLKAYVMEWIVRIAVKTAEHLVKDPGIPHVMEEILALHAWEIGGTLLPVALGGFLDTIDVALLPAADPHLLEVAAPFMVWECVDGEDLLLLYLSEAKDGSNLTVPVLELALVEQYLDVGVVDDGLLDNGAVYDVVQLLGDDTGNAMELADGLVQVLDVLKYIL